MADKFADRFHIVKARTAEGEARTWCGKEGWPEGSVFITASGNQFIAGDADGANCQRCITSYRRQNVEAA